MSALTEHATPCPAIGDNGERCALRAGHAELHLDVERSAAWIGQPHKALAAERRLARWRAAVDDAPGRPGMLLFGGLSGERFGDYRGAHRKSGR